MLEFHPWSSRPLHPDRASTSSPPRGSSPSRPVANARATAGSATDAARAARPLRRHPQHASTATQPRAWGHCAGWAAAIRARSCTWRLCPCWDTGCGPCGLAKAARLPECQCCQCVCRRCGSGWVDCYLYDCPAAVCAECGHRESACTCSVGFIPPACTRCGLPPPFECICCHGCSRLFEECEGLADCWEEGEDDYNNYDEDFDYY